MVLWWLSSGSTGSIETSPSGDVNERGYLKMARVTLLVVFALGSFNAFAQEQEMAASGLDEARLAVPMDLLDGTVSIRDGVFDFGELTLDELLFDGTLSELPASPSPLIPIATARETPDGAELEYVLSQSGEPALTITLTFDSRTSSEVAFLSSASIQNHQNGQTQSFDDFSNKYQIMGIVLRLYAENR